MGEYSWIDYWNLKYNPFQDFPVGSGDNRKYVVITKSIEKIRPEVQTISNSPVGTIKLVVGSKGGGKTSWLYSLYDELNKEKKVFTVYVNMFRSISAIKDVGSTVFMERYLLNDIVAEILAKSRKLIPQIFQRSRWLEDVAKNVVTLPMPKTQPNISSDNLFDILKELTGYGWDTFVIAIDELDKLMEPGDPSFDKHVAMICDFFGTQQGLFQKLATDFKTSSLVSCDERLVGPLEERNLTYLTSRITVERLSEQEARKMLRLRLKPQTDIFPFSEACVKSLVSYFQGNARKIILNCEPIMREAAVRGLKTVDVDLPKQLFPKEARESFENDFQDLARYKESFGGAKRLWRLSSKISNIEERKEALTYIGSLHQDLNVEQPKKDIYYILKDNGYVIAAMAKGQKDTLDPSLYSFLDLWLKRGHSIQDLTDWYSTTPVEPCTLEGIDSKVYSLAGQILDEDIKHKILGAYDIYAYTLDSKMEDDDLVKNSWKMLEILVKAYCEDTGVQNFALPLTEEKEDTHPSAQVRDRTTILNLFKASLGKKNIRLACYENVRAVRGLRNAIVFEAYHTSGAEANNTKNNAKMCFEEIISKWKPGFKITTPRHKPVVRRSEAPYQVPMYPEKPYTNMQNVYDFVERLSGSVRILDKNLDTQSFKFLLKLQPSRVDKLHILSSRERFSTRLKEEYKAFQRELNNAKISAEFRIMNDEDTKQIHDRYIITDHVAYVTPPWNIIHLKLGDIVSIQDQREKRIIFEKYWARGTDILKM